MSERKQTRYDKLVARQGNDYYFLNYTFAIPEFAGTFKGATGTMLRPVSKDEYEERTSGEAKREWVSEVYDEQWRNAVASMNTELGLREWVDTQIDTDSVDDEGIFDLSYPNFWSQLRDLGISEEEYPIIECIGGGRCFDVGQKFDEVYDQVLIEVINKYESKS